MKLFVVIYIAGQIGGTVGPVPYDMDECRVRAAEMYGTIDPATRTPQGITKQDVRFECELHAQRPANQR
jgi:hypothetical protein